MLELSALGLLQREPLHGYRLKQQLELFMGSCISVNYGAIYPLLKRLEERGEIEVSAEESSDAGPCRKTYSITAKGRASWRQKMLEHPQESWVKSRSRFMIKFFFFNDLEPAARIKLLEHRLMVCRLRQEYLENQEREQNPADPYQRAAWQRSLEIHRDEMQWLNAQLAKEQINLPATNSANTNEQTKAALRGKRN